MDLLKDNISTPYHRALASSSEWKGQPSVRDDYPAKDVNRKRLKVIRYDPDIVKEHIQNMLKRDSKEITFNGVEELKKAAKDGILRQGQLIFGTVSVAHHEDEEGTLKGWLYNILTPFIMKIKTGQTRDFAYLHTAVYAGKLNEQLYVIHNDGAEESGYGYIDVSTLEEAFERDSVFFGVSPPKDYRGKSTRYLVLQRALASLGLQYIYNMRAVSCETFATALFGLLDDEYFEPIQLEVLRTHKKEHPDIDGQKKKDIEKFRKFYEDLCKRIEQFPSGTILTLEFYINGRRNKWFGVKSAKPWFKVMSEAYTRYLKAAKSGDIKTCLDLLKQGLNPEGRSPNYVGTAVVTAARANQWKTVEALIKEGAEQLNQLQLDAALIKAAGTGNTDNVSALLALGANIQYRGRSGKPAAIVAALGGFWNITELLVKKSVSWGNYRLVNEVLIKAGELGNTDILSTLLSLGADIQYRDNTGSTAIMAAARRGLWNTVELLLKKGASRGDIEIIIDEEVIKAGESGNNDNVSTLLALSLALN